MTPWTVTRQAPLSLGILQARLLEWVAMPSSRESFQPRNRTQVSCITGGFFTIWATRKPISSLWMFMYHTEFIRRNKATIESSTGPVVGMIITPLHSKISTFKSPKPLKMLPSMVKNLCRSNKESWNGRIILGYQNEPNKISKVLASKWGKKEGQSQRDNWRCCAFDFEDGGRDHEARNLEASRSWKKERTDYPIAYSGNTALSIIWF